MKKIRPYAPPFLQPFDFWPAFVLVLVAVGCAMVGQGLIALAVGAGAVVTLFFVSGRSDAACHQYREDYVLHLQQFSRERLTQSANSRQQTDIATSIFLKSYLEKTEFLVKSEEEATPRIAT